MPLLIEAARPGQWAKNLVCLFGVIFSGRLDEPRAVVLSTLTFITFSLASGAVYIFNDLLDVERDRRNPLTAKRPIASGRLKVPAAWLGIPVLLLGAWIGGSFLDVRAGTVVGAYVLLGALYCLFLKEIALWDIICVALGFVFRVISGVYAVGALPTPWIVLCTFFLALFLGLCKRLEEISN